VINLLEGPDNTRMIDARDENSEKVCEECRLLLEIEGHCLVVDLNICHTDDNILELIVLPSIRRALYHGKGRVIL
jgi:hypothetical protein